jgi:hypothetical protein
MFLCLPMLLPPGLCACGAEPQKQSAPKCGCCHKAARKSCPAKSHRVASQPRSADRHALSCPAHQSAGVRLVKQSPPVTSVDLDISSPADLTAVSVAVHVSRPPLPRSDAHSDPPIYLLACAFRC